MDEEKLDQERPFCPIHLQGRGLYDSFKIFPLPEYEQRFPSQALVGPRWIQIACLTTSGLNLNKHNDFLLYI